MTDQDAVRVLVVDDESSIREVLEDFLSMEGFDVTCASNGREGVGALGDGFFEVLLIDMKMPEMNGLDFLKHAVEHSPRSLPIMMTGYGTVETAITTMKNGAYDYILKPFKVPNVIQTIERGLEKKRLEAENIQLREALNIYHVSEEMSGTLSLDRIFEILIEAAREEIEPDGVSVWLRQGEADVFEMERQWTRGDLSRLQIEAVQALDINEVDRRVNQGESLLLHGSQAGHIVDGANPERGSLLCIPFRTKNTTLGYFTAFSFDRERPFREGKRKMFAVLCGRATAAIENAQLYRDLKGRFKQTIQAFANLLEDKDPYTRGHSERVSKYARLIAEEMGLPEEQVERIADAALVHDIGKLGIRFEDLNKAGPLTESEYEMFKSHTTRGKWMLEPIEFMRDLIPGVYHHHERWDGKGYPMGLEGEETPLMARILAVADTYDAMTSHRAYRRALPHGVAVREINAFAGTQFDPEVVEHFLEAIAEDQKARNSKAERWKTFEHDVDERDEDVA
ncbi:MAG: HD domain-containing phosphohydrolase [Myxococcota bacterium]